MGEFAWLRSALREHDLELEMIPGRVQCTGSTFTTQTMDREWFDFTIPLSAR